MRVLAGHLGCSPVRASKHNRDMIAPSRHIVSLARVGYELVCCNKRKIPTHEFYNGSQARLSRSNSQPRKSVFRNRSVNDSLRAPLRQHPFGYFIGSVIFRNLFAHNEYARISSHFFIHCLAKRFPNFNKLHSHYPFSSGANTPSSRVIGSGQGLSSA